MPVNLFVPCFIDQLAPALAGAAARLLDCLGVAWEYPLDQTCCGQFALTVGDFATARRLMRHFLRVFSEAEAIVCPSASCALMVRHYYPKLAESLKETRQVEKITACTWELGEWLAAQEPLPWTPAFSGTLVCHRSCKARQLGVLPGATQVLAQVRGLTLKEISPYYACCGFGGAFKYQHPDISRTIGEAYLDAVRETGAQGLVSLDYSCLLHLRSVAAVHHLNMSFYHLAELVQPPKDFCRMRLRTAEGREGSNRHLKGEKS